MPAQRILIAEDDAKTASLLRLYLEHAGFTVSAVCSGKQALAAVEAERPHLLLLDVMLPEADGIAVCRALRAKGDLPIIMVTARTTEEDKLRGLRIG
ncbi:MAG: response regulator, partial [Acidobacteria bacterium]|nr:response regulator [Acidobacteriota bacterium]